MNEQSNIPLSPEPAAGVAGWFSTWLEAVTKPNEQTFANFAAAASGKLSIAFLWVFLGSLATSFIATLVQRPMMRQMVQMFRQMGVDVPNIPVSAGSSFVSAICGAPVMAVITVVLFAISVGLIQWVAKMFGGRGTFEQLAYAFAAFWVPVSLVNALLTLLSAIPFVGLCFGIVSFAVSIYAIVLGVMAVKGVNQFDWGKALGAYFLPGILIGCVVACVVLGLIAILAQMFSQGFAP